MAQVSVSVWSDVEDVDTENSDTELVFDDDDSLPIESDSDDSETDVEADKDKDADKDAAGVDADAAGVDAGLPGFVLQLPGFVLQLPENVYVEVADAAEHAPEHAAEEHADAGPPAKRARKHPGFYNEELVQINHNVLEHRSRTPDVQVAYHAAELYCANPDAFADLCQTLPPYDETRGRRGGRGWGTLNGALNK